MKPRCGSSPAYEPFRLATCRAACGAADDLARTLIVSGFLVRLRTTDEIADLAAGRRSDSTFPVRPAGRLGDLSKERFIEPFFDQTVARWASGHGPALSGPDSKPSSLSKTSRRSSRGHDFHLSRWVDARVPAAGHASGVIVLAEPHR